MKIYNSVGEFPGLTNAVVTIGTFDGVHAGHQQIIRRLNEIASATGGETVLLTFFPHPRMVLQPEDNNLKLITTLPEKQELLRRFGIRHLIVQPFSREFSRMSASEFVRDILIQKIGMKVLVIGHDHHFGRNREGSYKDLEEMAPVYKFRLEEIPEQVINHIAVSSTKIRNALLAGDIRTANSLLEYDYSIEGAVIHGDKMGAKLGFPTANLEISEAYKLIPADGIYAVHVELNGGNHKGMLYIGKRPAFKGGKRNVEVHLFDFDKTIYGSRMRVLLKERIRDDMNFSSLDQLKEKMKEDMILATKILS